MLVGQGVDAALGEFAVEHHHVAVAHASQVGDDGEFRVLSPEFRDCGAGLVVGAAEDYGVGVAEGVARRWQRTAVEGHVVERGHKESLAHEVGVFAAQRHCYQVEASFAAGCYAQHVAAVGEGYYRLAERRRRVVCVVAVYHGHLHVVVGGGEYVAVEAVGIVYAACPKRGVVPSCVLRGMERCEECLRRWSVGTGDDEECAAVVDPCRQQLHLAGRHGCHLIDDDEVEAVEGCRKVGGGTRVDDGVVGEEA